MNTMNMKMQSIRVLSVFAVGATLAALSGSALASDGTITFTGSIDSSTCTVTSSGGAASFIVDLPQVSSKVLAAAGETAGDTAFTLKLSGCSDVAGNVSTNFEAGTAVDVATGRLNNTSGSGATNVQNQLLNADDGSAIVVGGAAASQNSHSAAIGSDGAQTPTGVATLNYFARYYATGISTAGAVSSLVTYSMILP